MVYIGFGSIAVTSIYWESWNALPLDKGQAIAGEKFF